MYVLHCILNWNKFSCKISTSRSCQISSHQVYPSSTLGPVAGFYVSSDSQVWEVKQSHYRPEQTQRVGRGIALLFRDLGTRRGWVVSLTPRPLYPQERPSTHCTGGWVGLRAGLDVREKSRPPPGFDPRTIQPIASCYTDWATGPTWESEEHYKINTPPLYDSLSDWNFHTPQSFL
jgi:hypothetical protein